MCEFLGMVEVQMKLETTPCSKKGWKCWRMGRQLKNQRGWAIVSTLISIVIGLLMIGGIFAYVKQSMDSAKVTDSMQQLQTIKMNVKQAFQSEPSFTPLGASANAGANSMLSNMGVFAQNMIRNTTGDVRNAWDGPVFVYADSAPTRYVIEFQQVPQAACIKMATSRDWYQTKVNGTVVWDSTNSATNNSALTTANTACGDATSNTMLFIAN